MGMPPMIEKRKSLLHWLCHERSGFLFPRLLGLRRLAFEAPLFLAGILAWYAFIRALPQPAQDSFFSIFESPWFDASFFGVLLYSVGIAWMRDNLSKHGLRTRLFLPSAVLSEYKRQFGFDYVVRALAGIQLAILGLFLVGALLPAHI